MGVGAGILVGAVAGAVLIAAFTAIEARGRGLAQPAWYRRAWRTDALYVLAAALGLRAPTKLAVALVAALLAVALGAEPTAAGVRVFLVERDTWARSLPPAVHIGLALVGMDFVGYWAHRAFHQGWLWRVHAIHHSSDPLDFLSSVRGHPLNELLVRVTQAVPFVLLGFDPLAVAAVAPFLTLWGVLLHANVTWDFGPLRGVLASPRFHRWHHTSALEGRDKNFAGLFPVWDRVFGTFYMPARVPEVFGAPDEHVPDGFLAQLAHPFRTRARSPTAE